MIVLRRMEHSKLLIALLASLKRMIMMSCKVMGVKFPQIFQILLQTQISTRVHLLNHHHLFQEVLNKNLIARSKEKILIKMQSNKMTLV